MQTSQNEYLTLQRWLDFFSKVTSELVGAGQFSETARKISSLPVPVIADGCLLYLADDIETPAAATAAGTDERNLIGGLDDLYGRHERMSPIHAVRTGRIEYLHLKEPHSSGISTILTVPAKAGPHVLGVLVLVRFDGHEIPKTDMALIADYAHRCSMVLENSWYQESLRRQKTKLDLVTNSLPALVAYIDKEKKYRFCNEGYRQWFGAACVSTVTGNRVSDVIGTENFANVTEAQNAALAGHTVSFQAPLIDRSGQKKWFEITYVPDIAQNGEVSGFVELSYDLTERKKTEEQLKEAKESADSANKAKSYFLANVSHEFRTPINVILGFSDLLLDSPETLMEAEKVSWIRKIRENGAHLLKIVNDLLDASKAESQSDTLRIKKERTDLTALLRDVHASLSPAANNKGLQLYLQLDLDGVKPLIETDATRLRQILMNLISNSIKFTDRGRVDIRLERGEDRLDHLSILVSDTGRGISRDDIDRLFTPFFQAGATPAPLSTGLGLALSKKLARQLGGDLLIEQTEPGKGSTFRLTLPAGEDTCTAQSQSTSYNGAGRTTEKTLSQKRILVIDDSEDSRDLTTFILRKHGAIVATANDGETGIAEALRGDFDLILTDIRMPGISGYEVARELRAARFEKPILALTANVFEDEVKQCFTAGCDGFIAKPIEREDLLGKMCKYLGGKASMPV